MTRQGPACRNPLRLASFENGGRDMCCLAALSTGDTMSFACYPSCATGHKGANNIDPVVTTKDDGPASLPPDKILDYGKELWTIGNVVAGFSIVQTLLFLGREALQRARCRTGEAR